MAKVVIKSEKIMPYGGIYFAIGQFKRHFAGEIDRHLGLRCRLVGYQYSEIVMAMMCNFLCGGDRTEDLYNCREGIGYAPGLGLCSPDTVLRGIAELTEADTVYSSASGGTYRFNTAERLNGLPVRLAVRSGQLVPGREYDLDFDHEFGKAEKWDAKWTYKGMRGYSPGIAILTDVITGDEVIVGVENRDGNTPVKFRQQDTLLRIIFNLAEQGIRIRYARMDCGSYSREVVRLLLEHCRHILIRAEMSAALREELERPQVWRRAEVGGIATETTSVPFTAFGHDAPNCRLVVQRTPKPQGPEQDIFEFDRYTYRAILTNNNQSSERSVIERYNKRGAKERDIDQLNNDFGWHYLPKSEMGQNAAFMLLSAIIFNFYRWLLKDKALRGFGVNTRTRLKAFLNRFIAVPAKWTTSGRQRILNLYTHNRQYQAVFTQYG